MRSWHALLNIADSVDHTIVIWPSFVALHGTLAPPSKYEWRLVGPQMPPGALDTNASDTALDYLDAARADQGERSVLYVSFGSLFFPPNAHQLGLLLAAAERADLRVLMVGTAAMKEDSRQVVQPYTDTGNVLLVPWVDQPRVLKHKVSGSVADVWPLRRSLH